MQQIKTKHKDKEIEKDKEGTNEFYTGFSHNTGVVQSSCTSKGFHYNHTRLQIALGPFRKTSWLKHNYSRLPSLGH